MLTAMPVLMRLVGRSVQDYHRPGQHCSAVMQDFKLRHRLQGGQWMSGLLCAWQAAAEGQRTETRRVRQDEIHDASATSDAKSTVTLCHRRRMSDAPGEGACGPGSAEGAPQSWTGGSGRRWGQTSCLHPAAVGQTSLCPQRHRCHCHTCGSADGAGGDWECQWAQAAASFAASWYSCRYGRPSECNNTTLAASCTCHD